MDWCVDTRVDGASSLVESEIVAHLARHAIEPAVVELTRPEVHKALDATQGQPVWVTLDWSRRHCILRIRPVPGGDLVGEPLGPGATLAHEEASRLATSARDRTPAGPDPAPEAVHELAVARAPEADIDVPPAPPDALPADDPALLVGLIGGGIDSGSSLDKAAARAGVTLAGLVAGHGDEEGAHAGRGTEAAARRFIEAEERLGADFEMVESEAGRAVIRNRRCPFGPATSPSLCRFTSALAGGLAARDAGRSDVTLLESLASGDRECRLVIDTRERLDRTVSHRYTWPPSDEGRSDDGDRPEPVRRFQVTLSLQLPRDRLSVPITRHLIRAAMDEVGVVSDDADAVDLAVTEACANVIDHSGPGDAYDVAVSISPSACHIRVVDVGRGFDHEALHFSPMAAHDAEHGRGVALMHALVDQVRFESEPERGTVVHLVKRLTFEETAAAHRLMGEGAQG
ncbi:MAG TPA: ATP-binding protein [Acidimicrobiales bacterium]|nr:ATP-binding protein [Acidimicrobiales bacterium]